MNVLHCADLHFDDETGRLKNTIACCDHLIATAQAALTDLILIAGDVYDKGLILGSPGSLAAIDFVHRCGNVAPVVITSGTPTHDAVNSTEVFNKLNTKHPVHATSVPHQIGLTRDECRFIPINGNSDLTIPELSVLVSCLPSVTRAGLMAVRHRSIEETAIEAAELSRDLFQAWGVLNEKANCLGVPTILVGHGAVRGSRLSAGQRIMDPDAEFGIADLKLTKAILICLGHIHMKQKVHENAFYSGSITRADHGETEEKGFFLHTIEGRSVTSAFTPTPARVMRTLAPDGGLPDASLLESVKEGDYVRIVYTLREEDVALVDEASLTRLAYEKGAAHVKIDKTVVQMTNVRAGGISRLRSLEEKLERWGELNGQPVTPGLVDKLRLLRTVNEETILSNYLKKETPHETPVSLA